MVEEEPTPETTTSTTTTAAPEVLEVEEILLPITNKELSASHLAKRKLEME